MRYLGIDYGTKKIGLALSDEAGVMGFPHDVIPLNARLVETLAALIAREDVGTVVIGESRDYAGNENPIAVAAKELGTALGTRTGVPIVFEPETLTTAEARRMRVREPRSRRPVSRAPVDAAAAALILTSYLSRTHETS